MPMKRICFCLACTLFLLSGCAESQNETQAVQQGEQAAMNEGQIEEEEQMEEKMIVEIGSSSFTATLAENEAAQAFAAHLQDEPLTVSMSITQALRKWAPWISRSLQTMCRPRLSQEISCFIREIRSSCSMVRIPGAIQSWERSMICAAGKTHLEKIR